LWNFPSGLMSKWTEHCSDQVIYSEVAETAVFDSRIMDTACRPHIHAVLVVEVEVQSAGQSEGVCVAPEVHFVDLFPGERGVEPGDVGSSGGGVRFRV